MRLFARLDPTHFENPKQAIDRLNVRRAKRGGKSFQFLGIIPENLGFFRKSNYFSPNEARWKIFCFLRKNYKFYLFDPP